MKSAVKRIAVLTSGGDAPGMNAAVRAVYRSCVNFGIECLGIYRGWNGLINSEVKRLDPHDISHIINRGGTILYSARSKEFMTEEGQIVPQPLQLGRHRSHYARVFRHIQENGR